MRFRQLSEALSLRMDLSGKSSTFIIWRSSMILDILREKGRLVNVANCGSLMQASGDCHQGSKCVRTCPAKRLEPRSPYP